MNEDGVHEATTAAQKAAINRQRSNVGVIEMDRYRDIAEVHPVADGTRVVSLPASTLRTVMADEPTLAAQLLLNVSQMLCWKLALQQEAA